MRPCVYAPFIFICFGLRRVHRSLNDINALCGESEPSEDSTVDPQLSPLLAVSYIESIDSRRILNKFRQQGRSITRNTLTFMKKISTCMKVRRYVLLVNPEGS